MTSSSLPPLIDAASVTVLGGRAGLVLTARVAALHAAVQTVATGRDHVVRDVLVEATRFERWLLRDVTPSDTTQES